MLIGLITAWREKALRERLRSAGRYRPWPEIEPLFKPGSGTLVLEILSFKQPYRVWYTDENLVAPNVLPRYPED